MEAGYTYNQGPFNNYVDKMRGAQCYVLELRWRFCKFSNVSKIDKNAFNIQFSLPLNVFCPKIISLLQKSSQICPKYMTIFFILAIYATLTTERCFFLSLFLPLGKIRRVLSAKIASNQLKISQKIDLDSFQGIDQHREPVLLQKSCNFT